MRKKSYQIVGDRLKPVPSSGDEIFLTDEGLAAKLSPKTFPWPSLESRQGAALNAGPHPPRPLPTEPGREPKVTSPAPRKSGALRDRNREEVGDQQKSAPSGADETLLTEQQVAARWQLAPKTLRNARVTGRLIGHVKIGRSVRYRLSEIIAYELQNSMRSTTGAEE
jgi:hypothetical protein